jgi:hypothetical protein
MEMDFIGHRHESILAAQKKQIRRGNYKQRLAEVVVECGAPLNVEKKIFLETAEWLKTNFWDKILNKKALGDWNNKN